MAQRGRERVAFHFQTKLLTVATGLSVDDRQYVRMADTAMTPGLTIVPANEASWEELQAYSAAAIRPDASGPVA